MDIQYKQDLELFRKGHSLEAGMAVIEREHLEHLQPPSWFDDNLVNAVVHAIQKSYVDQHLGTAFVIYFHLVGRSAPRTFLLHIPSFSTLSKGRLINDLRRILC